MMNKRTNRLAAMILALILTVSMTGCAADEPETTVPIEETAAAVQTETAEAVVPIQEGDYTFRISIDALPENWSPLDWSGSASERILDATAMGLYALIPDETGESYAFQPEMAASAPVDVTVQYAGDSTYGVPEDAQSGYAYQIDLNENAVWEDGTPINADTYIYSMQQLLSTEAKHSRAFTCYSEQLRIVNAYSLYMQDQIGKDSCYSLADAGYSSINEAMNDGQKVFYLDMTGFWKLDCGWQSIDSEIQFRDEAVDEDMDEAYVSAKYLYETYLADGAPYAAYQAVFVGIPDRKIQPSEWEDVGFLKTGEYQITLVLEQPISAELLQLCLTDNWLVYPERYERWGSDYGTSVETYVSYGPYKLESMDDSGFLLVRNDSWYGYSDGMHQGQYQPTAISCRLFEDQALALEAFENGELDTVTVSNQHEGLLLEDQTYVSKLSFNISKTMLNLRQSEGINKNLLSYQDFRAAISRSIDRTAFVEYCVPVNDPALGLLGDAFILDVSTAQTYRQSEYGTQVLTKLYGADGTGYDVQAAADLFQKAYDAALENGDIQENDTVELEFLVYSEAQVYTDIITFLQDAIDTATAGTSLENRVRIVKTVDPDYYQTAKNGEFEIILSTWGGNAADPYGIMSCYCDNSKCFEFGFDPSRENCSIELNGTVYTKTYRGWYESLVNGKYAAADSEIRNTILAGLEYSLLAEYNCIPLYERNSGILDSDRVVRTLSSSCALIGWGDVRYVNLTVPDFW